MVVLFRLRKEVIVVSQSIKPTDRHQSLAYSQYLAEWIKKHPGQHRTYKRWVVCPKPPLADPRGIAVTVVHEPKEPHHLERCPFCGAILQHPVPIPSDNHRQPNDPPPLPGGYQWGPSPRP